MSQRSLTAFIVSAISVASGFRLASGDEPEQPKLAARAIAEAVLGGDKVSRSTAAARLASLSEQEVIEVVEWIHQLASEERGPQQFLSVRVMAEGRALAGVRVGLSSDSAGRMGGFRQAIKFALDDSAWTTTDVNGLGRVKLPGERFRVHVERAGATTLVTSPRTLSSTEPLHIVLGTGRVFVRVVDARGAPCPDFKCDAWSDGSIGNWAVTPLPGTSEGAALFTGLPPGPWHVRAQGGNVSASQRVSVVDGQSIEATLVVPAHGVIVLQSPSGAESASSSIYSFAGAGGKFRVGVPLGQVLRLPLDVGEWVVEHGGARRVLKVVDGAEFPVSFHGERR